MSTKLILIDVKIPALLFLTETLGALCLAAGLWGHFAGDGAIVAGFIDLSALSLPLIILGVLLMAPLLIFVVRHVATRAR